MLVQYMHINICDMPCDYWFYRRSRVSPQMRLSNKRTIIDRYNIIKSVAHSIQHKATGKVEESTGVSSWDFSLWMDFLWLKLDFFFSLAGTFITRGKISNLCWINLPSSYSQDIIILLLDCFVFSSEPVTELGNPTYYQTRALKDTLRQTWVWNEVDNCLPEPVSPWAQNACDNLPI